MTAKAAYQFLKPSLEGFSQKEKEELCRLIGGEPKPEKKKIEDDARTRRIAQMKKKLLKTGLFKN